MKRSDHYKTLGVAASATPDDIKQAYRKLARQYHPDVSKAANAEARFKEIGEAHQVLTDPALRAAYDRGEDPFNPGAGRHGSARPSGWNPGFNSRGGFSGGGFDSSGSDPGDLFENLMGRQRRGSARPARPPQATRGEDIKVELLIDLLDAYHGASRSVHVKLPTRDESGQLSSERRTLEVNIPKGIRAGQQLRLAGQGGPGQGAKPGDPTAHLAGDLLLELAFRPHPHFRVDGADVRLDLPVAPWEAALGADIPVPTPDGLVQMAIPPNTPSGRTLRLTGKGIPSPSLGKPAGDLYAVIQIALPPADTEAARQAYADLARVSAFNPRAGLGV